MKNPVYLINKTDLLTALKSKEFSFAMSSNDIEAAADILSQATVAVGHDLTVHLKVKNRRLKKSAKDIEAFLAGCGTTIKELTTLNDKFKRFLYLYFSIPEKAFQPISFDDSKYDLNKKKIDALIRFNEKINNAFLPLKDKITKEEFIDKLFSFAQPFVMRVDKKISPDVFTEETIRQCYALISMDIENQNDPYRELTAYLIQKFVGYTKYKQNRTNTYIQHPTYYLKFRAGIQVLLDEVTDVNTGVKFSELPKKKQYAYIELWIKYNLDVYLSMNNYTHFNVVDEPTQIGFIAGRNPNSRENALNRFNEALDTLKKTHKPKPNLKANIDLTKKLNDW